MPVCLIWEKRQTGRAGGEGLLTTRGVSPGFTNKSLEQDKQHRHDLASREAGPRLGGSPRRWGVWGVLSPWESPQPLPPF